MEIIRTENLSFTYPKRRDKALFNINLSVKQGEFVLILGKSGCGKTTLLRMLKNHLAPFGEKEGEIYFNGKNIKDCDEKKQAGDIGFVMQSPDNQIVTDKVWHELSFGLESLSYKQSEIRTRVSETASFFGIENWFYKNVWELSGGEKQLLNLASVMAMSPSLLILDEPTSQLDPIKADQFLRILEKINRQLGITIILTEHRLEEVFPLADRVIVMDDGKIIADDVPDKISRILKEEDHDMQNALPTPVRVHSCVENSLPCPITVKDGRAWLLEYKKLNPINPDIIPKDKAKSNNETVMEIKDAYFRYEKDFPDVIKGFNLSVKKGELFCILGGNGTGKTTALSLISGINAPYRGNIKIKGQSISKIKNLYNGILGVLPQNPQSVFAKNTVYLDLEEMLSDRKLTEEEKEQKVKKVSNLLRIEHLLNSHPFDLSGGEQQRCALAKILLLQPEILLLDEPTKGMDAHFKEEFAEILMDLKADGKTVLMVSHDIEFCAKYADRCALMFDGNITSEDTPREFFKGKNFYTTSANRMARNCLSDAVLAEDIILACGGKIEKKVRQIKEKRHESEPKPQNENKEKREKLTKSTVFATLLFLLLIPLTIYIGVFFLGSRKYYFISLLIILETMVPFFMVFEKRKPKARELIVISVLSAIAVLGRTAFFMLPQFKPASSIVIIAGIAFGGEVGFLVGALCAFISNFFFGQGPWTPWQMFAFGIIGFIAGILFKKGFIKKTKGFLSVFGFFITLVIYGGIMNPASIIMYQNKITWEMIALSYIKGLPLDLIHALSSGFFLWFISDPMIEKLERIKIKFGILQR